MTDQPLPPQFVDEDIIPRPVRGQKRSAARAAEPTPVERERRLTFLAALDKPLLGILGILLMLGLIMVYSATFNWSLIEFGSETAVLMSQVRNMIIGLVLLLIFARMDTRIVRRLAVIIMLMAISFLISVLLFGDDTFNARRALINGRFQPGEFSELAIIIYMSAWLGSKNMRVRSLAYGLIPFTVLVGIVSVLVVMQPDLSTAAVICMTAGIMFFLAGADMRQVTVIGGVLLIFGLSAYQFLPDYAKSRVDSFRTGIADPTQANYHTQQALVAIWSGGWTGVGLGESTQKFQGLPAQHTDSIFAVICEELGVLGASVVILLYMAFAIRGFQISRRADDAYKGLLAAGITVWVIIKAMLNIAVMTNLIPSTGLPLPFISFGGSSLVVLLVGVGLLLSVQRDTLIRQNAPERRKSLASVDRSRWNRGARVPRAGHSRVDGQAVS